MRITNKGRRLVGLGTTTLLLALGVAASASAAPAQWAGNGGTVWAGTLSVTHWGTTKTCPNFRITGYIGNLSGTGILDTPYNDNTCGGQLFQFSGRATASTSAPGVYALTFTNPDRRVWQAWFGSFVPAYTATWQPQPFTVAYTNAVGATTAKMTFNNTVIGSGPAPVTATGTLSALPAFNADLTP